MVRNLLLIFFIGLWSAQTVTAQPYVPKDVNLVYRQLQVSKADTNRVTLLINIARYCNANWTKEAALLDSAFVNSHRAIQLSQKLGYAEGVGVGTQVLAQAYCNKKDFKKSDELIKKAIAIFLNKNLYRDAAEAYLNMEEFYLSNGGSDYKVMIGYYEQARPLFNKARAFDREGATLTVLGDFYQVLYEDDKALERLNQALAAYNKVKYPYLQSTYDLLGFVNAKKSRYNEALKYGLLALKTAETLKDTSLSLCTTYSRLAIIYSQINKEAECRFYFEKALEVAKKYNDRSALRVVLRGLISTFLEENQPAKALAIFNSIRSKYPPVNSAGAVWDLLTYLTLYSNLKNFNMAKRYADSLVKTNVLAHEVRITPDALEALADYESDIKRYDQALKHLYDLRRLAIKYSLKRYELRAYLKIFKADSAQRNYLSAFDSYQKYNRLKDSLFNVTKTGQLEELEIRYETEKKEKSIVSLKKESLLQQERVKQANYIRNITIIGSIILLSLVMLLYRSSLINKQNVKAINEKNVALSQLINEKEWLIKEIHHRVKNNLQIVTGLLQRQSAYINNDAALAAIQNSENRMHAIALIHQKLYQSESLDLISMPDYIEEMIGYLKDSSGIDNRILFEKYVEDIELDVAQAVPLGLIMNEAITNAIKYAYRSDETGVIYITLVRNDDQYNQLTIADNGPGLPPGFDIEKVDSLGINLMRGLCKQLAGTFEISNEQGCTINITFKTETFSSAVRS